MTRHIVEATYILETQGPLHIGTGHGAAGLHRAMMRDEYGLPYIPGSSIKGRARYAAIRICEWMELPVLKDAIGDPRGRCPNGPHGQRDLPNRIFGCAWSRCTLRFGDARTDAPEGVSTRSVSDQRFLRDKAHGYRELRTGAARSRFLGTVSHRRLFQSEVAPPGLRFRGSIHGYLDCEHDESLVEYPPELLVLWLALHLMVEDGIGANKTAGSGKLVWAKSEGHAIPVEGLAMTVDGEAFSPEADDVSATLGLLRDIEPSEVEL